MSATVEQINRYLANTQSREKLCRFVQYFARFYAFYLYRNGAPKDVIRRWDDLKLHIGNGRKFFRLFKQFEFGAQGVKSLSHKDEVLRITGFVKNLFMALYYTTEAFVLVNNIGFYKLENAKKIQQHGMKCWFIALAVSLLSSAHKFRLLSIRASVHQKSYRAVSEKSSVDYVKEVKAEGKALETEKRAIQKQVIQDLLDMVIPTAGLGWVGFDEGIVGLAGMATSWMAIVTLWKKAA